MQCATSLKTLLAADARRRPSPSDWVYVNNFAKPDHPKAIELPSGRAVAFREAMHKLIEDLQSAAPAAFQSEDYQTRRGSIDEAFQKKQFAAFNQLRENAAAKSIVLLRTPVGFALAPAANGEVVPPDEFNAWPPAKRAQTQADIEALEKDLEHIVRQIPQMEKQQRDEIRALNRDTAEFVVDHLIQEAKAAFSDIPEIAAHIDFVRADLIENMPIFVVRGEAGEGDPRALTQAAAFERYEANVLISQNGAVGAPLVEELHPTLGNLIGRIDYVSAHGVLVTNFLLIKAGALHRASGGYLVVDARSLLMEPFSWTALKRTLRRGEIAIEDVGRFMGLTNTVTLEPDPIPLRVKVVLFGDRLLYFLLCALDPELREHFKLLADFEDDLARTPDNEALFARLIASAVKREGLLALDRSAVARVIEHVARMASHSGKLSLSFDELNDALTEADLYAREAKRATITRLDIDNALDARIRRASRLRDRMKESVIEKVALIATEGLRVGQINGLSVLEIGGFAFGRPTRITCQVRPGGGKVVDIEREVELGGPIHSKGVLILSGLLAGRYALDTPMSLYASLVFEQSYGGVEGDSASSAELYALLSALAETPIRQDLAVTGSVNQYGEVQAIGGVNEKIEGFFDICLARGLTGSQGVLIPASNAQHLMLRDDVVKACADGPFRRLPHRFDRRRRRAAHRPSRRRTSVRRRLSCGQRERARRAAFAGLRRHPEEFRQGRRRRFNQARSLTMATAPRQFRRLVLGLQAGPSRSALDLAIEFAQDLDLELLGVFLEDAGLRRLAGMPSARALHAAGGGWRDLDWARISSDLDLAEAAAERQFAELARGLARRQFEVVRGGAAFALASLSRADDILLIDAPLTAADRVAEPFASMVESAFRSAAAVMLAPRKLARRSGPIVAVATRPDDPSIAMAQAIAALSGQTWRVLQVRPHVSSPTPPESPARRLPGALTRIATGAIDVAIGAAAQTLRQSGARLAVVSRREPAFGLALAIELATSAPVLSIEEPAAAPDEESGRARAG